MMNRSGVHLFVRQQPHRAMIVQESNPKNRKPVDPPPIVELKYDTDRNDRSCDNWLVSPRMFMVCTLIEVRDGKSEEEVGNGRHLLGQTTSSLHRLKDHNNKDGGYFVFGDVSAKKLGNFKLRFTLYDRIGELNEVHYMSHIDSDAFQVCAQRDFGAMSESTSLTRTFSDQGVKLRVRKDNTRNQTSIGTKRPFNASPAVTSSPHHAALYGGPVQDHHYGATTPEVKRQRADSDYGSQNLYSGLSIPENSYSTYNNSIPSSTRQWASDEQQHRNQSYSQHSPLNPSMMHRMQPMNLSTTGAWQTMHHSGALPSPSPSVSTQTPAYPVSSQPSSTTSFGDSGANSSIPRGYYNTYQYPSQSQYDPPISEDTQSPYHDPHLPVTTLSGAATLGSTHTHPYANAYLPSGTIFDTEAGESNGVYAYMDATPEKY